jgi:pimeloyl-ACP methyl ester carboxylesterase
MEAQVNGIKLHYEDHGQGKAVLLVHAFPLAGAMWQQQVAALKGQYRLIVPDMRGFGASEGTPGPTTMETFADDLAALLDTLGIDKVVLGGLSMGGYISFAFLRRHADRLRGLILCDTRATPDTPEGKENRETTAQMVENEGARAIADKMLPVMLSPAAPDDLKTSVRGLIEQNSPQGIAAALRGMALRPDSSDLLPTIKVPTMVVVGSQDVLSTPKELHGLQAAIPGSRFVELGGAGHVANLENPEAFNDSVRDFLAQV